VEHAGRSDRHAPGSAFLGALHFLAGAFSPAHSPPRVPGQTPPCAVRCDGLPTAPRGDVGVWYTSPLDVSSRQWAADIDRRDSPGPVDPDGEMHAVVTEVMGLQPADSATALKHLLRTRRCRRLTALRREAACSAKIAIEMVRHPAATPAQSQDSSNGIPPQAIILEVLRIVPVEDSSPPTDLCVVKNCGAGRVEGFFESGLDPPSAPASVRSPGTRVASFMWNTVGFRPAPHARRPPMPARLLRMRLLPRPAVKLLR